MDIALLVPTLAVYALPVVLAITLHEAAHGYVAKQCGDLTAYRLGRVSLNPLRHVDLVGTIIVPLAMLFGSVVAGGAPLLFGWAKPVPVNFHALRRPRTHMMWVAAAGPGANLLQAVVWGIVLRLTVPLGEGFFATPLVLIAQAGIAVNLVLMVLNLIPILPLDGGRITYGLLPDRLAASYGRLEPYGFPILLLLMFVHFQTGLLNPLMNGAELAFGRLLRLGL
jgi:Zn-dependent protease